MRFGGAQQIDEQVSVARAKAKAKDKDGEQTALEKKQLFDKEIATIQVRFNPILIRFNPI